MDGVFGIETLERGELYYDFVVRGDVENATINEKIDGDIGITMPRRRGEILTTRL
jgi:hypothetical protein